MPESKLEDVLTVSGVFVMKTSINVAEVSVILVAVFIICLRLQRFNIFSRALSRFSMSWFRSPSKYIFLFFSWYSFIFSSNFLSDSLHRFGWKYITDTIIAAFRLDCTDNHKSSIPSIGSFCSSIVLLFRAEVM